jgi:cell division protease FtsH
MANNNNNKRAAKNRRSGRFPDFRRPNKPNPPGIFFWAMLIFLFIMLYRINSAPMETAGIIPKPITYSEFFRMVEENPQTKKIAKAAIVEDKVEGQLIDGTRFSVNIPANDTDIIKVMRNNIPDVSVKTATLWSRVLYYIGPTLLFLCSYGFLSCAEAVLQAGLTGYGLLGRAALHWLQLTKSRLLLKMSQV